MPGRLRRTNPLLVSLGLTSAASKVGTLTYFSFAHGATRPRCFKSAKSTRPRTRRTILLVLFPAPRPYAQLIGHSPVLFSPRTAFWIRLVLFPPAASQRTFYPYQGPPGRQLPCQCPAIQATASSVTAACAVAGCVATGGCGQPAASTANAAPAIISDRTRRRLGECLAFSDRQGTLRSPVTRRCGCQFATAELS